MESIYINDINVNISDTTLRSRPNNNRQPYLGSTGSSDSSTPN